MTFNSDIFADAVDVLQNGLARRARMKAMGNFVPGQRDLVARALVVDVEEELLGHTGAWMRTKSVISRCAKCKEMTHGSK